MCYRLPVEPYRHRVLYGELLRQSNLWAYVGAFRLLAGLTVLCVPAVFIFKRARRAGPAMAH